MATQKSEQPAKRKYRKKSLHWKMRPKKVLSDSAIVPENKPDNSDLVGVILNAVDRLTIGDKARVFAYILGKEQLDENQLWAVEKILS